jgi:bifunctional non-homologous end joining protein LigD
VRRTPEPIPAPPEGDVEGALETPDGQWRVEAIRRPKERFFRLIHGDNVVDGLTIATVERLLREAGVDMADLIDVTDGLAAAPAPPGAA